MFRNIYKTIYAYVINLNIDVSGDKQYESYTKCVFWYVKHQTIILYKYYKYILYIKRQKLYISHFVKYNILQYF